MKDKIKYRRQGQGRRPSHGSRKRHPPHRRDAGSSRRQWLPDLESRKQHPSGHGYSRSQARHDREQRQLHPFSKANKLYGQVEWIELYFEIAVYNSQYQIDSVHRGECYE